MSKLKVERLIVFCKKCKEVITKEKSHTNEKHNKRVYCSRKCMSNKVKKTCIECNKKYEVHNCRNKTTTFCSKNCQGLFLSKNNIENNHPNWNRVLKNCKSCNKEIYVKQDKLKENNFCSRLCFNDFFRDSVEVALSKSRNNSFYKKFRKEVLLRDKVCKKCGSNKKPNVHHIEPFHSSNIELKIDPNNGILLCQICHIEFHKIYTKYNFGLKQLNEFLCKK